MRLLAVALGVVLCAVPLAVGEFIARRRIARIPPSSVPSGVEHPPYYNNPGVVTSPRTFGHHLSYRINRDGLRGAEVPAKGAARRVLMVGDSLIFGAFAGEDETLPVQLERLLEARAGGEWQVLNGGVASYDAWDYEGFLARKGLAFEPDIVVLGLFRNDHLRREAFARTASPTTAPRWRLQAFVRALLFKSELFSAAVRWLQRNQDPRRPRFAVAKPMRDEERAALAAMFPGDPGTASALERFVADYRYDASVVNDSLPWLLDLEAWRGIEEPLRGIRALCAARGVKLMAVIFPTQLETLPGYAWPQPRAVIRSLFEKTGIPAVDLLPAYRAGGADALFPVRYDISHPGARGYALAAEAVYGELDRLGWTGSGARPGQKKPSRKASIK